MTWQGEEAKQRLNLKIEAYDKQGLMRDIAAVVAQQGASIAGISGGVQDDGRVQFSLVVEVVVPQEAATIMRELQKHPNIYFVGRG